MILFKRWVFLSGKCIQLNRTIYKLPNNSNFIAREEMSWNSDQTNKKRLSSQSSEAMQKP